MIEIIDKLLDKRLNILYNTSWIKRIYTYLDSKNKTNTNYTLHINNIIINTIPDDRKLDILDLLKTYLGDVRADIDDLLLYNRLKINKIDELLLIIINAISYQNNHNGRLNKSIRYDIRRGFCIDEYGKELCDAFLNNLKQMDIFDSNADLLFNPYTSIINIIEIYSQVNTEIKVDYSFYWNNMVAHSDTNGGLFIYGNTNDNVYNQMIINGKKSSVILDIIKRICIFNYLGNISKLPRKLTIYWIDYKKYMMTIKDDKDLLFTSSEINTGVTNGTDIIITRKEECLKTVLHECCHLYDWDFKVIPKELSNWFLRTFPIKTTLTDYTGESVLNIFEAYTEWFASIVDIIFRYPREKFISKMKSQILYTSEKGRQILQISNCKSIYQFINNKPTSQCTLQQSTNVFSYFILKLFLYWRCDILVNFINDKGQFIKHKTSNLNVFKDITSRCIKNKELLHYIEYNYSRVIFTNTSVNNSNISLKMVK
jgi:hypothetical protein